MRKLKKYILGCLLSAFALTAPMAVSTLDTTEAQAAVATEYTVVETAFMAKISEWGTQNGNFKLVLTLSDLDTDFSGEVSFEDTDVDLPTVF